jgi:hypothetical protein
MAELITDRHPMSRCGQAVHVVILPPQASHATTIMVGVGYVCSYKMNVLLRKSLEFLVADTFKCEERVIHPI